MIPHEFVVHGGLGDAGRSADEQKFGIAIDHFDYAIPENLHSGVGDVGLFECWHFELLSKMTSGSFYAPALSWLYQFKCLMRSMHMLPFSSIMTYSLAFLPG